ncbi:phosphotransferase [Nocardia brevicatena]|uniref:phosphotransferase n=1 Tax=Nocardia brevicatena TaxID=37327 RepID=UPI0002F6338D
MYEDNSVPTPSTGPAGIDAERVTAWFVDNVPNVRPPLRFELNTGGRSNLAYRVHDETGTRWVLRRPPTGHVLASAHDVVREFGILDLPADSPVPVPPVLGCCTDHAVDTTTGPLAELRKPGGYLERQLRRRHRRLPPAVSAPDPSGRSTNCSPVGCPPNAGPVSPTVTSARATC